ncbi:MAG: DUF1343 domain-containing protein [Ignavibacteria bacterium]|nr:MAG: DUF1343 domain-containing protein [Ignavibacteria bacterium]
MKYFSYIFIILNLFTNLSCQTSDSNTHVFFGNELLLKENIELLKDKRVGVVTNHSAVLPNNVHLVDTLLALGINITALFSPEHGIRGEISDGSKISSSTDDKTGIQIFSLYGNVKKPAKEMLKNIDIILFDIQDIGARFYTYISTLYYLLQSAAENNLPVIVLDRPNPISGLQVGGAVLDTAFKSFIGIAPIPVLYGMTIGEIAKLFVEENFINTSGKPELAVIKMKGWKRNYFWANIDRDWIPTSPNIPNFETALIYPGTAFIEGTNISEGRGTEDPFLTIGAPFINSEELINILESLQILGIEFSQTSFTPVNIKGKATNPKYEEIECYGIKFKLTDKKTFKAVEFGVYLIYSLLKLYPDNFKFKDNYFDKLAGTDKLRKDFLAGKNPSAIIRNWESELEKFKSIRKKYLLY